MLQADAGITDAYLGAVPAQIVVVCGVFGNITASDVQATVAAPPSLCAHGALVVWTRHRMSPDLAAAIRSWFVWPGRDCRPSRDAPARRHDARPRSGPAEEAGFREEAFDVQGGCRCGEALRSSPVAR